MGNLCVGLALCQYKNTSFMTAIGTAVVDRLPSWNGMDLSFSLPSIIWSFAKLETNNDKLMAMSADCLLPTMGNLPDWSLCALVWSLPRLSPDGALSQVTRAMRKEVHRRGLTANDVELSTAGSHEWSMRH